MNKKSNQTAIIIGAGIAGISAAIRLKKKGFNVIVFESASSFGGKIKEYRWQDFRFDTGPSLFTLPQLVDELFELCNKNPRHYFTYSQLPLVTKYFYANGTTIDSFSDAQKFASEAETKTNIKAKTILRFLEIQKKTYNLLAPIFLENPIHIFSRLLKWKNISALIHISNPRFLFSLNNVNQRFFKNDYLVKLFNRYGTYNGSNPYKMPSLFNIISHLEHNVGAYLPKKGIFSIPQSLYQLAQEEGVVFEFNAKVDEIIVEKNQAIGVKSNGKNYSSSVVVSNMDANFTYQKLLPNIKAPKIYLENEKSTSALIFHWAIEGNFSDLDVHNILFANDYKAEFEHLFDKKTTFYDPTIYIYISSKAVESDAPSKFENWFVMINMPNLSTQQTQVDLIENTRQIIIRKINTFLKTKIETKIIHEHITTPTDLQNTTHSYLGSLYGGSSNSIISAFLRHPNFSKINNLYFCGGTVHPGGGIPLCLLSAKIATDLIAQGYNQ